HADALYVIPDPIANTNRIRINTLALGARLPTMLGTRDAAREAGLMSYGPKNADLFRRAGDYVDKILRGAKPGDIQAGSQPNPIGSSTSSRPKRAGLNPPRRSSASPTR